MEKVATLLRARVERANMQGTLFREAQKNKQTAVAALWTAGIFLASGIVTYSPPFRKLDLIPIGVAVLLLIISGGFYMSHKQDLRRITKDWVAFYSEWVLFVGIELVLCIDANSTGDRLFVQFEDGQQHWHLLSTLKNGDYDYYEVVPPTDIEIAGSKQYQHAKLFRKYSERAWLTPDGLPGLVRDVNANETALLLKPQRGVAKWYPRERLTSVELANHCKGGRSDDTPTVDHLGLYGLRDWPKPGISKLDARAFELIREDRKRIAARAFNGW